MAVIYLKKLASDCVYVCDTWNIIPEGCHNSSEQSARQDLKAYLKLSYILILYPKCWVLFYLHEMFSGEPYMLITNSHCTVLCVCVRSSEVQTHCGRLDGLWYRAFEVLTPLLAFSFLRWLAPLFLHGSQAESVRPGDLTFSLSVR